MYEDRVLAFIDILGISNAIDDSMNGNVENVSGTKKINDLFDNIQKQLDVRNPTNEEYKKSRVVNFFSDTIIISYLVTEKSAIFYILADILFLCCETFRKDFLFRGAIVCDKLYHEKEKIFGPALVKAYKMEKELAIYPRIILDDSIINILKRYDIRQRKLNEELKTIYKLILKDFDGLYFLNYFDAINIVVEDENGILIYFEALRKVIINLERKINGSLGIKSKFLWLKEKYNLILEKYKKKYCSDGAKIKSPKLYGYLKETMPFE
jgi:hypothetical protein